MGGWRGRGQVGWLKIGVNLVGRCQPGFVVESRLKPGSTRQVKRDPSARRCMRFFTREWWCGIPGVDLVSDRARMYRSYLATIRDRLPAGLLALQESVSLHDGRLRELDLSPSHATLILRVDGDDGAGGRRRFTLRYSGLRSFQSIADPAIGLCGPHGYGDWGYDEADVMEEGRFEHRILFSSGIEFIVQFTGFEFSYE